MVNRHAYGRFKAMGAKLFVYPLFPSLLSFLVAVTAAMALSQSSQATTVHCSPHMLYYIVAAIAVSYVFPMMYMLMLVSPETLSLTGFVNMFVVTGLATLVLTAYGCMIVFESDAMCRTTTNWHIATGLVLTAVCAFVACTAAWMIHSCVLCASRDPRKVEKQARAAERAAANGGSNAVVPFDQTLAPRDTTVTVGDAGDGAMGDARLPPPTPPERGWRVVWQLVNENDHAHGTDIMYLSARTHTHTVLPGLYQIETWSVDAHAGDSGHKLSAYVTVTAIGANNGNGVESGGDIVLDEVIECGGDGDDAADLAHTGELEQLKLIGRSMFGVVSVRFRIPARYTSGCRVVLAFKTRATPTPLRIGCVLLQQCAAVLADYGAHAQHVLPTPTQASVSSASPADGSNVPAVATRANIGNVMPLPDDTTACTNVLWAHLSRISDGRVYSPAVTKTVMRRVVAALASSVYTFDKPDVDSVLLSPYRMSYVRDAARRQLSRRSYFRHAAHKAGLIRPFLLLVSMPVMRRWHWAVRLGCDGIFEAAGTGRRSSDGSGGGTSTSRGSGTGVDDSGVVLGDAHHEAWYILCVARDGVLARASAAFATANDSDSVGHGNMSAPVRATRSWCRLLQRYLQAMFVAPDNAHTKLAVEITRAGVISDELCAAGDRDPRDPLVPHMEVLMLRCVLLRVYALCGDADKKVMDTLLSEDGDDAHDIGVLLEKAGISDRTVSVCTVYQSLVHHATLDDVTFARTHGKSKSKSKSAQRRTSASDVDVGGGDIGINQSSHRLVLPCSQSQSLPFFGNAMRSLSPFAVSHMLRCLLVHVPDTVARQESGDVPTLLVALTLQRLWLALVRVDINDYYDGRDGDVPREYAHGNDDNADVGDTFAPVDGGWEMFVPIEEAEKAEVAEQEETQPSVMAAADINVAAVAVPTSAPTAASSIVNDGSGSSSSGDLVAAVTGNE